MTRGTSLWRIELPQGYPTAGVNRNKPRRPSAATRRPMGGLQPQWSPPLYAGNPKRILVVAQRNAVLAAALGQVEGAIGAVDEPAIRDVLGPDPDLVAGGDPQTDRDRYRRTVADDDRS